MDIRGVMGLFCTYRIVPVNCEGTLFDCSLFSVKLFALGDSS